jgi:hypothetical protein
MIKKLELFIERRDRISRTGVPRQVENEIEYKKYTYKLTSNGQGISGNWFLVTYRRFRLNGNAGRSEVHPVKPMGLFCLTGAEISFQRGCWI